MGDMKLANMSMQLADKTIKYPVGILEDIPIKVEEFYVLVNFVIMEIEEDSQII